MGVRVTLPIWNLPDTDRMFLAAAGALWRAATEIMADSKSKYVPVDTGTLRSSGIVDQPSITNDLVTVTLGFGGPAAPYALAVHENPRSGKTGGMSPSGAKYDRWAKVGQWKYLSTPFEAARGSIGPRVLNAVVKARRQQ